MIGWLIDTLLYTGLLIGLVLVLRRPVGRWFGPQIAYGLWALPFLRLLLPPIVLPASFAPEPEPVAAAVAGAPVAATAAKTELVIAAPLPAPASSMWEWADLGAVAISLWAGVAMAFLAWRVVTYRRMRREVLVRARPVGEIGKVRLVETPALAAPVAFGVLDKVIALPPLFMAQPDIATRDLAIAHELAHHEGHDLLANMAAQALLAVHWFNPLAWMGWRAMRRDQEAACDARVLAGKDRQERVRYAALIAGVAAGARPVAFRGALAAPMACPVLGDKSIIHRLRSLSMTETTPRRRWLGRSLIGAGVLALPLTASISYAAGAQAPDAEAAPVQPLAPAEAATAPLPEAPEAPLPMAAPGPGEPVVRQLVLRRDGSGEEQSEPLTREFSLRRPSHAPAPSRSPQLRWQGNPLDPEFETQMEQFQREMSEYGRAMEKWGEEFGKQFGEEWAEQHRGRALAWAEAARRAPEVVQSCDEDEMRRTTTEDGRQRVVICERRIRQMAGANLRFARESIARNREISEDVRREVLQDLDREIERLDRESD